MGLEQSGWRRKVSVWVMFQVSLAAWFRDKGKERGKATLRFPTRRVEGDSRNGKAGIAVTKFVWWEVTRSVWRRLIGEGWQNGPGELSAQRVLNLTWMSTFGSLWNRMTLCHKGTELSPKKSSCRTKQKIDGDSPFILSF